MFSIGGWELLLILFIVLLLFGGKRLPELARGLGKGIREFKQGLSGVEESSTTIEEERESKKRSLPSGKKKKGSA